MKCPKCNGEMEEGGLQVDAPVAGPKVAAWIKIKGKDRPGIKVTAFPPGIEKTPSERYPLTVYRCQACGFLESYAREEA